MSLSKKFLPHLVSVGLLFSAMGNVASALDFPEQTNVLGVANVFGYLSYQVDLGEIEQTEDVAIPVRIDFSSDPKRRPSMLGWGWRFPLLESSLYQVNEDKLRWDAINGETYYLFRGKEPGGYELPGGGIVAEQGHRSDDFEIKHNSGWIFEYSSGSLRRFTVSDGTQFYMREGHRRMISSLTDDRGRPLFEVRYDRSTPEQLIFNHTEKVNLEFSEIRWKFALQSEDVSEQEPERVRIESDRFFNLASITFNEGEAAESYSYAQGEVVTSPDGGGSAAGKGRPQPGKKLPSELEVTSPSAPAFAFGWDGVTGHLTRAGDDSYEITPRSSPFEYSKVVRTSAEGATDSWDHDVKSGVKTFTGRDGLTLKAYYILSKGELYGKLRKQEALRDGKLLSKVVNSYDPAGQLVRAIEDDDVRVWDRGPDGREVTEYLNGVLKRSIYVDADGREVSEYIEDGNLIKTVVEQTPSGGSTTIASMEDYSLLLNSDGNQGSISTVSTPNSSVTLFRVKNPSN